MENLPNKRKLFLQQNILFKDENGKKYSNKNSTRTVNIGKEVKIS
jgi:hypothetical protein